MLTRRAVRRPHIIRANHSLESPWECVWFDTETRQELYGFDTSRHTLRFGWAAYRRRLRDNQWSLPTWQRFTSASEFWAWITALLHGRSRLYLFAHNAGFDLPVVDAFRELPRLGFVLTKAVIDCPPVRLKWRREQHTIEALDTLNIWRMPLESIGRQVGIGKLPMPAEGASADEWDIYCRRDVEVIMTACLQWFDFLQLHRLGGFAPTLAAQAMRAYRHRFMTAELLVDCDENALELARAAYCGGRVECWRIGRVEGPVYRLDVNSMYPYVMRDNYFPTKLLSTTRRASCDDLRLWLRTHCVTALVDVNTEEPVYPVLGDDKLLFPVGRFTTTLCTPELAHALDAGRVVGVHHVAVHERAIIFREFVDECWSIRRAAANAGDGVTAWQIKILGNSLYGKFGQRGRVYREAGACDIQEARAWLELDLDTGQTIKHRALGGLHQIFTDDSEAWNSMPAIAAHVTAYARLELWRLSCLAGRENVLYNDTDSLDTTSSGYHNLLEHIDPERLGGLKLERVEPWMEYYGPKDYRGENIRKTKGVRSSAVWLDEHTVVQSQWSTLVGLLRTGDVTAPTTKAVSKTLARIYTKGEVDSLGRVVPLRLDSVPVSE